MAEPRTEAYLSHTLAFPKPPMRRVKRHGTIGTYITPAIPIASTGKHQRMIFAFIVDA